MRIGYSEDEDYPGQFELWQANCQRSLQGKAGQASLRELEQALLALPDQRLIAGELEDPDGDVCAVGALKKFKGVDKTVADPECMEEVGEELGMPHLVAWKVVWLNDMEIFINATPEVRYEKVLRWVRQQLQVSGPLPS